MQHSGLKKLFNPQSIAVVGASDKKTNTGYHIVRNLILGGYSGRVYPVNHRPLSVLGSPSHGSIGDLPERPDLVIIAIPAESVTSIIEECGQLAIKAAIVISAGFTEGGAGGKHLAVELSETAKKYGVTLLGPNCLGFIRPQLNLNASFTGPMPISGNIAFISQSGAMCSAILDWSIESGTGFSYFVSVGEMLDIQIHDLIDYFGNDQGTSSILIYLESLSQARRFMSAARAYARNKPIIILKTGRSEQGSTAARSHTGRLAGNDIAFDAAFKRAGVLRVKTIAELFDCASLLAGNKNPSGERLTIVTNAGGPGVIATDALIEGGGELTAMSELIMDKLNSDLPPHWSHANPVDILGDADAERYGKAISHCLEEKNSDATLVILTPQAMTEPDLVAAKMKELVRGHAKPVLAAFMGEKSVERGRALLRGAGIPVYANPEPAVQAFLNLRRYSRNLELLYETPGSIPAHFNPDRKSAALLIRKTIQAGRTALTEHEAKQLLTYYEMPVVPSRVVKNASEAAQAAEEIGFPVVLKIISPQLLHKSEAGGVILGIDSRAMLVQELDRLTARINAIPGAEISGYLIERQQKSEYELFIGAKKDAVFGPLIFFGMGGVAVEVFKDIQIGLPPLNMALAQQLIEETKIYKLLSGFRGSKPVDIEALKFLLYKFSYLLMDFPEIVEIDINPYGISHNGGAILDARVLIDISVPATPHQNYSHMVISPYPSEYVETVKLKAGDDVTIRPIRPEDEAIEAEMFTHFSEQTLKFRFFKILKDISHHVLIRFTQIDYDREIALLAEQNGKMLGVARLISESFGEAAEFAIVVADPYHGRGLGSLLTDRILAIARQHKTPKVYAVMLKNNIRMEQMLRKRGFSFSEEDDFNRAELVLS